MVMSVRADSRLKGEYTIRSAPYHRSFLHNAIAAFIPWVDQAHPPEYLHKSEADPCHIHSCRSKAAHPASVQESCHPPDSRCSWAPGKDTAFHPHSSSCRYSFRYRYHFRSHHILWPNHEQYRKHSYSSIDIGHISRLHPVNLLLSLVIT